MKLFLSSLALVAFSFLGLSAQISFTRANFPIVGQNQYYQFMDTAGAGPGASGTGVTWDFSATTIDSQHFTLSMVAPSTTANAALFGSSSNIASSNGSGEFRFYDAQTATWNCVGVLDQLNLNNPIKYTNVQNIFAFPASFGATITDSIIASYTFSGFPATRHAQSITTLDGSGLLKLPDGRTFPNAVRIHQTVHLVDTATVLSTVATSDITINIYEWRDTSSKFPIMVNERRTGTVSTSVINTLSTYYASFDTIVGREHSVNAGGSLLNIFPNPVSDISWIEFRTTENANTRIEILNVNGQVVSEVVNQNLNPGIHRQSIGSLQLGSGIYFMKVTNGSSFSVKKFTIL